MNYSNDLTRKHSKRTFIEVICCTLIMGLLAHGIMLFNKLSWHDDIQHGYRKIAIEKPIGMGRWLRALLSSLVAKFFGGYNLSLPLFHGIVSILFIALSAYLVVIIFDIQEKLPRFVICGIMVCFPVVTSIFAYMFTAPYYFFSLFLSVAAVFMVSEAITWPRALASSILMCLSLGIYQAFFPVSVSLLVMLVFYQILSGKFQNNASLIKQCVCFIGICLASAIEYVIVSKAVMAIMHLPAVDYMGFSTIGQSGIEAYLHAFIRCYKSFFMHFETDFENLFPAGIGLIQKAVIVIYLVSSLILVIRRFKENKFQGVILALIALALPVCINLMYLMSATSPDSSIHTLMFYAQATLYVYIICAVRYISIDKKKVTAILYRGTVFLFLALSITHAYFDNACYLKAQIIEQRTISYSDVLTARIKGTEGYSDNMPVCFVTTGKTDKTITSMKAFSLVKIKPYDDEYLRIPHHFFFTNLLACMKQWCGFDPKYVDQKAFRTLEEVEEMPSYPDDGSIRIIDDTVVIKW